MSKQKMLTNRLMSLFESHPNGLITSEIKENLKITSSSLYSLVCKMKKQGIKIKNKHKKYYLTSQKNLPVPAAQNTPEIQQTTSYDDFSNKKDINIIVHLSDSDKHDYLDMLKKSIFYKLSANAILQANQIIEQIKSRHSINL